MLSRGQHDTHHPLLVPYSTVPRRLGRRYEARRPGRQRQPPLRAQLVDFVLKQSWARSTCGRFGRGQTFQVFDHR